MYAVRVHKFITDIISPLTSRQWNEFITTAMIPTAGDLRRRRDRHVWTEAAWDAEEASLPLGKNWRWLRSDGGGEAFLVKGEGMIERYSPGEGGDLTHTGTMLLPSGPGSSIRF